MFDGSKLQDDLNRVSEEQAKLAIQKDLMLKKALQSNDVDAIFKAQEYLKQQNKQVKGLQNRDEIPFKSILVDPMEVHTSLGFRHKSFSLSYDVLRAMARTHIIKSIIETRRTQVSSYCQPQSDKYSPGFVIQPKSKYTQLNNHKELTDSQKKKIDYLVEFLINGGTVDNFWEAESFDVFVGKILVDSLTVDQACSEIIRDNSGEPCEFKAVDAATIRKADTFADDYERTRQSIKGYYPTLVQVINGNVVNEYYPWEMMFGIRNPSTDIKSNGYGRSELEDMVQTVTALLNADYYNANFFKVGSAPKGILKYSGDINMNTIEQFKSQWIANTAGVLNCLHGDTEIWVKDVGLVSLENIYKYNEEYLNQNNLIWTGTNFEPGKVHKTSVKQVHTITLNNGLEIKSSSEHRFKTIDSDGELVWKERKDLKEGDFLLVNKNVVEDEVSLYYGDKEVEEDLFELLGWLTGDGYIGDVRNNKRLVLLYNYKKELNILHRHKSVLDRYGINNNIIEHEYTDKQKEALKKQNGFKSVADKHVRLYICDINFYNFVINLGFKSSKEGKVIPKIVHSVKSECKCAFLRGLFSADGCNSNGRNPQLAINNVGLKEDVVLLLLSVGIRVSGFRGHKNVSNFKGKFVGDVGVLLIKDRDLFFEKINFIQDYKKNSKHVTESTGGYTLKSLPQQLVKKYLYPIKEKMLNKEIETTPTERRQFYDLVGGKDVCSLNRFIRLASKYNVELPKWIFDYYLEPIVSLGVSDECVEMYDVEMFTEEHELICNGMLGHNSHKIPLMNADKLDFINLQQNNRDMEFAKFQEFLIKISCALYKIDPSEIGFPMAGASETNAFGGSVGNAEKLKYSKDKGLKPLLKYIERWINKYIIHQIDANFEFRFVGLDNTTTYQEELEYSVKELQNFKTLNEVRNQNGLSSVEGGDFILNPIMFQKYMADQQAKQQEAMMQQQGNPYDDFYSDNEDDYQDQNKDQEHPLDDEENPFAKSLPEELMSILSQEIVK